MNENIITGSALDKTAALRVVGPLHLALSPLHMFRGSVRSSRFFSSALGTKRHKQKSRKSSDFVATLLLRLSVTKIHRIHLLYTSEGNPTRLFYLAVG
jgi:hypothetical protein